YACSFGGTSAAAPLVTGIIGLLLSVDSNLTRDHVQEIIRASAIRDLEIVVDTTNPEHIERYGYGRLSGVRALSTVLRGDVNGNQMINIGDLTYLEDYLYHGGPEPYPNRIFGDVNCSGTVNMSDMTYLINYLYSQGPPPPCPCIQFGD
ncbi:MAG: S8 family serine peptidase, partial [candidate division Zixibacteria bacterium]|nr:S8 family serine peptidase [candidate division Zixibacteria bacterium]